MLLVTVQCMAGDKSASGVTWNGSENLTQFFTETNTSENTYRLQGFRLLNPTETTANVVVTMDSGDKCSGSAINFTGVNLSAPIDLPIVKGQGGSGSPTLSVSTITNQEMVVDLLVVPDSAPSVGSGQTQRYNLEVGGGGAS